MAASSFNEVVDRLGPHWIGDAAYEQRVATAYELLVESGEADGQFGDIVSALRGAIEAKLMQLAMEYEIRKVRPDMIDSTFVAAAILMLADWEQP